jgi:hypothetical protein
MTEHFKLFKTNEVEHIVNEVTSLGREVSELTAENTRLKELNGEMAKVLRRVCEVGCLYKGEGVPNLCGNCIIGFALKEDIAGLQSLWRAEEEYDEWTNQLPSEEDWGDEE